MTDPVVIINLDSPGQNELQHEHTASPASNNAPNPFQLDSAQNEAGPDKSSVQNKATKDCMCSCTCFGYALHWFFSVTKKENKPTAGEASQVFQPSDDQDSSNQPLCT